MAGKYVLLHTFVCWKPCMREGRVTSYSWEKRRPSLALSLSMWSARSQIATGGCSRIPAVRSEVVRTVHHTLTYTHTHRETQSNGGQGDCGWQCWDTLAVQCVCVWTTLNCSVWEACGAQTGSYWQLYISTLSYFCYVRINDYMIRLNESHRKKQVRFQISGWGGASVVQFGV